MAWRTNALTCQIGWAHDARAGSRDHNVRQHAVDGGQIADRNSLRNSGDHAGAVGKGKIKSATSYKADQIGIDLILQRHIKARGGVCATLLCKIEGGELHTRDIAESDCELHGGY